MFFRKKKVGPEYYFERGEECLERGNYQWALESFSKAIEFNPGYEMAYYRRAETHKRLGKDREAISDYIKFLEADRRQPDMAEDLDDALKEAVKIARRGWERDRAKEAITSFGIPGLIEELIEGYDPKREYPDRRFYDLALSWLRASPESRACHIGFVQLLKGDFDEAIKEFDRCIGENPEEPDAYYFRGVALLNKRRIAESKGLVLDREEKMRRLSEQAYESFVQALERDRDLRICPECGYRTSSHPNFCMYCGKKLLP
jgi:tetratricopeptide (TPR) repeat protein